MTSPEGPKGSSPLKVGGLALLGVGIVAAAVGAVGLTSGGSSPSPVAAPSVSTSAAPPALNTDILPPSAAPTPPPAQNPIPQPAPGSAAAAAPPPIPPPAPTSAAPTSANAAGGTARSGGTAGRAVAAKAPVRVYNNSTINGLAERAADDFRKAGWTVDTVDNYQQGAIPSSTVYFRPGTTEQAAADRMGKEFGLRAAPRFAGIADASPGLIVIVTQDYQRR